MNNVRISLFACGIVLVLACAFQSTEAGTGDWRSNPQVKALMTALPPRVRRMTEGPLGGVIDLIIDIILILLDIILGGALLPLKTQIGDLQNQVKIMGALLGNNK